MRSNLTPEELARRSNAILDALRKACLCGEEDDPEGVWLRPIEIAEKSGLGFGITKAALKRLLAVGAIRKREYSLRVMRGAVRKRYTSKAIVEYQIVQQGWPERWMPRAPTIMTAGRIVRGRCGCSG